MLTADPGDRVELDEAIAQIETDKVLIYRFMVENIFSFPSPPCENDLNRVLLIFYQVTIDVTSPGAGVILKVTIFGLLLVISLARLLVS